MCRETPPQCSNQKNLALNASDASDGNILSILMSKFAFFKYHVLSIFSSALRYRIGYTSV